VAASAKHSPPTRSRVPAHDGAHCHQPFCRRVEVVRTVAELANEAAATVHREAHGLEADEIIEVQEGVSYSRRIGPIHPLMT